MPRYAVHLAANDALDQVLYVEADLVQDARGFVPDPANDVAEVRWNARGRSDKGTLYIDEDATTNRIEWETSFENVSKTTLLAKAPNGSWRPLNVTSRVELEEPAFGYAKAV
jgi:hypothetical protein